MSAYETLAACYDELTYDIPYEKNLTFFERLCARTHIRPQTVLDLARCSSASGHEAVKYSEAMKDA